MSHCLGTAGSLGIKSLSPQHKNHNWNWWETQTADTSGDFHTPCPCSIRNSSSRPRPTSHPFSTDYYWNMFFFFLGHFFVLRTLFFLNATLLFFLVLKSASLTRCRFINWEKWRITRDVWHCEAIPVMWSRALLVDLNLTARKSSSKWQEM